MTERRVRSAGPGASVVGTPPAEHHADVVATAGRARHAVALAVLAFALAGCAPSNPGTAAADVTTAGTTPTATPTAAPARAVPLYYVLDTPAGPRLAREFRRLPVGDDPLTAGTAALSALLAAPDGTVPGHRNLWPAGTAPAGPVTHADGVVTVDLTPAATAGAPAEPLLAVQQLVYTVTGALGTTDPVRLLVGGQPVPQLWQVATAAPVARADPLGVRVLVGIDEPAEGATVSSPVQVAGEAAVFEATLLWEVRQGDAVVRSGSATTAEGQRFAPYSFTVALAPGEYEVRVLEDDPSDGAGRPAMTDARRITVTG